jgi:hypothetical protein
MEVAVSLSIKDIGEIEREVAHLIPQHPQYHNAGLVGFAYGGIALASYWLAVGFLGLPWMLGALIALTIAYLAGRYDGSIAWRHYHRQYYRLMDERRNSGA